MIRLPLLGLIVIALALVAPFSTATSTRQLMVCVDPNNLPFPNQAAQSLENKRVEPPARDQQAKVEHVRWSPRHADVQRTLGQGRRDRLPGVATGSDILATRRPDYRSSYVFVARADQPLSGLTLDDRRPRSLTIGWQVAGNDAMKSPPASATARRGLARNVQGRTHYGNYDWSTPAAGNVNALVTAGSMLRGSGGL
jgi:mxaJ protein